MEAGCREPKWNEETYESYEWKAQGELLVKGVCISDTTQSHLVPNPGKTKVHCNIKHDLVRHVDARRQTILVDLTLTMKWWDPNVKSKLNEDERNMREISLNPSAIQKIWTPDLDIKNLTSYKVKDEWMSLISSKVLGYDETNDLEYTESPPPNVEITYGIKASVYCIFDHKKYPMDKQECNLTIGSNSFGAIFVLKNDNDSSHGNSTYVASTFLVASKFFDDQRHSFGNNTIGIRFIMTHATVPYMVKYYIPCNAIVIISLMSFMIPLSAIPGRIALLVTQFLTLTNLFIYEMVS